MIHSTSRRLRLAGFFAAFVDGHLLVQAEENAELLIAERARPRPLKRTLKNLLGSRLPTSAEAAAEADPTKSSGRDIL